MVKDPIGDIENTHRNTFICCFENLEAKSIMFHPKLTNISPSIGSTKCSSETKCDINITQNISTRRSKKCYELTPISPSTHQVRFNCWRVTMTSLFLSICKVNAKYVTTTLCMMLGHLPYSFPMLGLNYPFVVMIT
jgi:hypothetical protein